MDKLTAANWIAISIGLASILFNIFNFRRTTYVQKRNEAIADFNIRYLDPALSISKEMHKSNKQANSILKYLGETSYSDKMEQVLESFVELKQDFEAFVSEIVKGGKFEMCFPANFGNDDIDRASEQLDSAINSTNPDLRKESLINYSKNMSCLSKNLKVQIFKAKNLVT